MKNKAYPSTKQSLGIVGISFVSMIFFFPVNAYLNEEVGISFSFLVYYVLTMLTPLVLFHFLKKKNEGKVNYQLVPKDGIVIALLLLTTLAIQWGITSPLTDLIPMPDSIKEMFKELFFSMNDVYGFLAVAIAAPVLEELIFRGIILDGLLKRRSKWSAIIISSLLFGLLHLNPWQFVGATILGIFIGWVYSRTHNIMYCMFIHFVNNFTAYAIGLTDPNGEMLDMSMKEMMGGATNYLLIIGGSLLLGSFGVFYLNQRMKNEKLIEESDMRSLGAE